MNSKILDQLNIDPLIRSAVLETKQRLLAAFPDLIKEIVLFGSTARQHQQSTKDSNIDLLIITHHLVDHSTSGGFSEIAFEVEKYFDFQIPISLVVVDSESWYHGVHSYTGLFQDIKKEGIPIYRDLEMGNVEQQPIDWDDVDKLEAIKKPLIKEEKRQLCIKQYISLEDAQ